jgi:hypothetical protein
MKIESDMLVTLNDLEMHSQNVINRVGRVPLPNVFPGSAL